MKDPNINRQGYKKTKVGWIPEEWKTCPAGEVFDIQLGKMLSKIARQGNNFQPYLANYNVQWGSFDLSEIQKMNFSETELEKFRLKKGDLLVCEGGEVGRCAVWKEQISPCFYQKALHRVRPRTNNIDMFFTMYYLHITASSPRMVYYTAQTSISHFTREQFLKLPMILPPLPEQKKIAEILSTWDEAINQTRSLIEAKMRRKKALMQQLLAGKKRLPEFTESWKEYSLGQLFRERQETNCGHLPLLAITGKNGIVPASDIERKDSSSADKSRYKRIAPGDIGYNTMRMWQGVSAVSRSEGIVSPAYTVCVPQDGVDEGFMGHLFKLTDIIHLFWRFSQGLVNDTLNLKFHNFSKIKITIPAIEEQRRITEVLSTADEEIKTLEQKLAALEKQKRGLIQKLLTGEVRVKR
ncbi:MAG: restriction endonuclease subunit S [Syntrophales bacterium]|jgi:type I restriction enzyme S subunit|nr:restriction endonuclease subunit S [Syntrophales bacterium]